MYEAEGAARLNARADGEAARGAATVKRAPEAPRFAAAARARKSPALCGAGRELRIFPRFINARGSPSIP